MIIAMKRSRYIQTVIAGISAVLLSCSQDREPETEFAKGVPAVIDVTIEDADMPLSRRNTDAATDGWTTKSFSAGDQIGIFSTGGLVGEDGESKWILNEFMNYDQATGSSNYRFRNDELLINTGMMGGKVGKYVYFPYTEEMPLPIPDVVTDTDSDKNEYYRGGGQTTPRNMTDKSRPGLYLRVPGKDYKNRDIDRCIDYMYIANISLTNGALGGGFYHGFSEMIIMRGEGFDQVSEDLKDEITVVLNNGYTRLRLNAFRANSTGTFSWRPQNYFWPDDESEYGLTEEQAKRWKAWKGVDYIDTDNGEPVPREAWYVILPTAHNYSYPSVTYIEIYNNEGNLCQVSNFELYVNPDTGIADKSMRPGKRYAVEVMMVEVGATVRPHEILDWNEGEDGSNDITDERTAGINNYDDFYKWAMAYNSFIAKIKDKSIERPSTAEEAESSGLTQYGDYDLDNRIWKFYITGDISLPNKAAVGINELQDVLEGASQVANYSISNLQGTFIETIATKGMLRNLDFDNLYVKPSSGSYHENTAGALTNWLNGGSIMNCNVNDGTMIGSSTGIIGMLCGTVSSNSTVMNCKVSGAMIGSTSGGATYDAGLFGNAAGATFVCENNDGSGLIIKSN